MPVENDGICDPSKSCGHLLHSCSTVETCSGQSQPGALHGWQWRILRGCRGIFNDNAYCKICKYNIVISSLQDSFRWCLMLFAVSSSSQSCVTDLWLGVVLRSAWRLFLGGGSEGSTKHLNLKSAYEAVHIDACRASTARFASVLCRVNLYEAR